MKVIRRWFVILALGLMLHPGSLCANWVVVDYDGQSDWVRHDFVGWVRVEQPAKPPKYARGTAAVTLKVIEQLAGEKTAPVITLEYGAPVPGQKGDELLAGKHDWHEDLAGHREYFVFLDRLPTGAYWCDSQREFAVRDGRILNLPGAYAALGNGETEPMVHEFITRARTTLPALRVRTGRPGFVPPLVEKGRPVETPLQGHERIQTALQAGNERELDRLIHSPDGSAPKGMRALLLKERETLVSSPVQWQAVLEDKAVVVIGPPGRPATALYLMRRGSRWLLLNTQPDTEAGAFQLNLLLTETQFAILTAVLKREHPGLWAQAN